MMSNSRYFTKDPSALLPWKFDWRALTNGSGETDWLDEDDEIASYELTVDAGITVDSHALTDANSSVTVWLSGGEIVENIGQSYRVNCAIVTANSLVDNRTIIITIVDK